MRMKNHMTSHIEDARRRMFSDSTAKVTRFLEDMIKTSEENMLSRMDEVFLSVNRDYNSALFGNSSPTGKALPREQRVMRKKVHDTVERSEKIFKRIVGLEPEEEEQASDEQDAADSTGPTDDGANGVDEDSHSEYEDASSVKAEDRDEVAASSGEPPEDIAKSELDGERRMDPISRSSEPRHGRVNRDLQFSGPDDSDALMSDSTAPSGTASVKESSEEELMSGYTDEDNEVESVDDHSEGHSDAPDH